MGVGDASPGSEGWVFLILAGGRWVEGGVEGLGMAIADEGRWVGMYPV